MIQVEENAVHEEIIAPILIEETDFLNNGGEARNNVLDTLEIIAAIAVLQQIGEDEIHILLHCFDSGEGQAVMSIYKGIPIDSCIACASTSQSQLRIMCGALFGKVANKPDYNRLWLRHSADLLHYGADALG